MRGRCVAGILAVLVVLTGAQAQAQDVSCDQFDSWIWAQSTLESDLDLYSPSLDPDGNGIACEQLITILGFSPAIWVDQIPDNLVEGQVVRVIDGDTLEIMIDGEIERVRIYRADTPELNPVECGGPDARAYVIAALSYNDNEPTVWLQKDRTDRDQYDRYLAYIWFTVDGHPYLLNELLARSGFANDVDYGDRIYAEQMKAAVEFAERHNLGVWNMCGGFAPENLTMPSAPVASNSGGGGGGSGSSGGGGGSAPAPAPAPTAAPVMGATSGGGCDPNYTPCVPNVSYDLDCGDIGHSVTVIGYDRHNFDRDGDGYGCESYG